MNLGKITMILEGLMAQARTVARLSEAVREVPKMCANDQGAVLSWTQDAQGGWLVSVRSDGAAQHITISSEHAEQMRVDLGDAVAMAIAKTLKGKREVFKALTAGFEDIDISKIEPDQP